MDIDLEDELRSEIDDLHFEVGELRDEVKKLVKLLDPPLRFDQPFPKDVFNNVKTKRYQSAKISDASEHLDDVLRYTTGGIGYGMSYSKLWFEDQCHELGIDPKDIVKDD